MGHGGWFHRWYRIICEEIPRSQLGDGGSIESLKKADCAVDLCGIVKRWDMLTDEEIM